jgi:glycosyltransferase involved in cell wall biosynthesis
LGYVSAKEKYKLMEKSWIFINPSFKEGWGIVNVEANYFGLPVIGSNVSGIKDSVVGGKTGILFEYGNSRELGSKILDLIKDKKLRGIMGKDAIKWARTFSWESAAREYLKILEEI